MGIGRLLKEYPTIAKGLIKSFQKIKDESDTPVDFVVCWVDGDDPAWLEQRASFLGEELGKKEDNHRGRYQAWDCFKYWFRAVEAFAPWVRNVFLVTWGHVPKWLNEECPKLRIVKHEEFIPAEYLPTFNSNTIEMNLFRIKELSENFVYFNDDMYLCRPVKKEEFFVNSKPRLTAISYPWINRTRTLPDYLFYNVYGEINKANDITACIKKNPEKWFSHLYKGELALNKYPLRNGVLPGMFFSHMGEPFSKSSMQNTWDKYEKACVETCMYRQRDIHQITHHLFSVENILNGYFYPSTNDWGYYVKITEPEGIDYAFSSKKKKMFCLFDEAYSEDQIALINQKLEGVFSKHLNTKSGFEK